MRYAGIDIGSRTIELVIIDEAGAICRDLIADTGFAPIDEAKEMIRAADYDRIIATGYGRNLFEIAFDAETVTEIKAHATAVHALHPGTSTILDIGGQDCKVITLMENGRVKKFEMNDRCAAGTGKFLEIMARNLGYDLADFGREALKAEETVAISSMCTVFAESEVTSLIAAGKPRRDIARGLHDSVARRTATMLKRISDNGDIVFTGGVAYNSCIVALLEERLQRHIRIPDHPQHMGALGAAHLARMADRDDKRT